MLCENLFEKIGFTDFFAGEFEKYNALVGAKAENFAERYMNGEINILEAEKALCALETENVSRYTYYLMFVLHSTGRLFENYKREGIPEEIFYDSMKDINYKIIECEEVEDTFGMIPLDWYDGFLRKYRHAFGRLQFDRTVYGEKTVSAAGYLTEYGEFALQCHIPSSGPLKHELCIDSYKRAYEFFKDKIRQGILVVTCESWLLYPRYIDAFGNSPNITEFVSDFEIANVVGEETFLDSWRVFGKDWDKKCENLPRDTGMRKNFAEYIENGGSFGRGIGVLLFDGEKILTKNQYLK